MKIIYALLISVFSLFQAFAVDPVSVTVLGDRVNLRNANTNDSEVVGQANYGDKLQAVAMDGDWVEVLPPEDIAVWVYSPLLFEDQEVRAPELNMRSGPGTQFIILGSLKRGDKVTVIQEMEEWRKVEAPESLTVWISRKFVQIPVSAELPGSAGGEEVVPVVTPTPTPMPMPTPITIVEVKTIEKIVEVEVPVQVTPTPQPQVQAPEGLDLVPLKGQGTLSKRRGILHAYLLAGSSPSRFMLSRVDSQDNRKTICYLIGNEELLKSATGKLVTVSGHDFWVTGERLPVTDVDSIEIISEQP
ncbi:SH3 domain-containing protein [Kiritimatiellota bacterium B12222]|nr:SH3 domain-containing protein [Kiritimatiellota bacterium B12222]